LDDLLSLSLSGYKDSWGTMLTKNLEWKFSNQKARSRQLFFLYNTGDESVLIFSSILTWEGLTGLQLRKQKTWSHRNIAILLFKNICQLWAWKNALGALF
jgi:hypothetical protein